MTRQQVLRIAGVIAAIMASTAVGIPALTVGAFVSADSSCDGGELRADPLGVWLLGAVAAVWASPFAVVAVWKRSRLTVGVAVFAVGLAAALVVRQIVNPGEFCF